MLEDSDPSPFILGEASLLGYPFILPFVVIVVAFGVVGEAMEESFVESLGWAERVPLTGTSEGLVIMD